MLYRRLVYINIYINYYAIVIRNGKIVWKQGPYCWYFRLNLKYLGWPYRAYIKRAKNGDLWGIALWKWLWGCFSYFLLLWPWCQGLWGSSEDRYRSKRVSQMLLVCYNLLNSPNTPITQWQWKMAGYKDTFNVAKKLLKLHRKKSNEWPTVSFIHNRSNITTWIVHSFKTKSAKSTAAFLR